MRVKPSRFAKDAMISPRAYVAVANGHDRTEHIPKYNMEKPFV